MYAKIKNSQIVQYPYGYAELQADNPYTNFNGADLFQAFQGTEENLLGLTLEQVVTQEQPQFDSKTQKLAQSSTPVFENGNWVLKWIVENKTSEELAQQDLDMASQVRSERNAKLSQSDWTQLADSTVDKSAWAAYRQALRDVPAQIGFPWAVNWPTKP